jgi:hypothetical protein
MTARGNVKLAGTGTIARTNRLIFNAAGSPLESSDEGKVFIST